MYKKTPGLWQPIQTAPKGTGDEFLAYDKNENQYSVCYYSQSNTLCEGVTRYMFVREDMEDDCIEFYPTHWMPLPKPPKTNFNQGD